VLSAHRAGQTVDNQRALPAGDAVSELAHTRLPRRYAIRERQVWTAEPGSGWARLSRSTEVFETARAVLHDSPPSVGPLADCPRLAALRAPSVDPAVLLQFGDVDCLGIEANSAQEMPSIPSIRAAANTASATGKFGAPRLLSLPLLISAPLAGPVSALGVSSAARPALRRHQLTSRSQPLHRRADTRDSARPCRFLRASRPGTRSRQPSRRSPSTAE
jgi:hypothetical protein